MWKFPKQYAVIVIGAGHAGCEAAHAAAKMGAPTLLLSISLDTVAKLSCNPAFGGIGKGHIVREIDALGGIMGKCVDATGIQFRMLNATKGPAVWSPRAQTDRFLYQSYVKNLLEKVPHLEIKQGSVESLVMEEGLLVGVSTKEGIVYQGSHIVISSGTFMRGLLHIGETQFSGGRAGDQPSVGLSASLEQLGLELGRLKTGTPPRINRRSIDYSETEEQPGEEGIRFSYDDEIPRIAQVSCHITYTSPATKDIILQNIHRSPMYSGQIKGVGPRYCPSIEDKMVRFADKERHQLFLEPEGLTTDEVYVNGVSSSLPFDVQLQVIHSIPALRNAEIMRPAYAIEYDYVKSGQIYSTFETKKIPGLFLAGQINGTTGYEEAGGQGLMAGINAACKALGKPPFTLNRSEAYLGVLVDDLIRKELEEPYRMFTSRAEHRLLLRQDNADLRLRAYGYHLGMISETQYATLQKKKDILATEPLRLDKIFKQVEGKGYSLAQLMCRPENTYISLLRDYPDVLRDFGSDTNLQIELKLKYAGYIERQEGEIAKMAHLENAAIPNALDYKLIKGLRNEAQQKLAKSTPQTIGQASRLSGVSPADISVLMIYLKK